MADVARSLEIAEGTLWNWVKADREAAERAAGHQREHQWPPTPVPPQGQSFASVTQDDLDAVAAALNTRPRKTHGYRTPTDLLQDSITLTG